MATPPDLTAAPDLTLAEKASLGSGGSFWSTKAVGSVASVTLIDGPHGLRKQVANEDSMGIGVSMPATCFPPAAGLAQTWNTDLATRVGEALGDECLAADVGVLLGPGVNIKRDPRGGRNFEYFSEDPILSGAMGAGWVAGVQAKGVGTSLKHFAANNAETDRMRSSSDVDERPLREIYLRAFQRVVTDAQPWTVMCSYNRINGVYASENRWLLTDVLRGEWGFTGAVISDWGAVENRPVAVSAGIDLEMPGNGGHTDQIVLDAIASGNLDSAHVDRAASRIAELAAKVDGSRNPSTVIDYEAHHELARRAAADAIVLLKNDNSVLPLTRDARIAVIGDFAQHPRYQGGGSSRVNPTRLDVPLDEIRRRSAAPASVTYDPGFASTGDVTALRDEAVARAAAADVAVVFIGLYERDESEGIDRDNIDLPEAQIALLSAVAAVQPHTVAVVSRGGMVRLAPIVDDSAAILDGALLGQGGGAAIADVLFGIATPSGKLAETMPVRIQDVPAFFDFPGENCHVRYTEGLHVGYRWYDTRDIPVTFPFGHGLSYTTFRYSGLLLRATDDGVIAEVSITNTGAVIGREVVQFYTALPESSVSRPTRELKGFGDITLAPGETGRVTALLRYDDLAYWDSRVSRWVVEHGEYEVFAASSSRDLRVRGVIALEGEKVRIPVTAASTLGDLLTDPDTVAALAQLPAAVGDRIASMGLGGDDPEALERNRMLASIPLRRLLPPGDDDTPILQRLLQAMAHMGA